MLFNSIEFALFLSIVFLLYYAIPYKYRNFLLVGASYYFYMCFNSKLISLIILTSLIGYVVALLIEKYPSYKKVFFYFSLLFNLSVLVFFKYAYFLVNDVLRNLLSFIRISLEPITMEIILPMGISFYTFQVISYSVDVYRGKIQAERNILNFALYVSFFPQLVAGPIERAERLLPQIRKHHTFDYDKVTYGLKLIAVGLYKKILVADIVASYVNMVYNDVSNYTGFASVIATLLFALQIYCDFSGYSDIARGSAMMLGINLMVNFKSPYFSTNIQDFWRRWHISLTTWFKDYIYIPTKKWGGGIGLSSYQATILVFLISGLWHGANYTFLIWGLLNGCYLISYRLIFIKVKIKSNVFIRIGGWLLTIGLVSFSWIFFRANSIQEAFYIVSNLFEGAGEFILYIKLGFQKLGISKLKLIALLMPILFLLLYDYCQIKFDVIQKISNLNVWVRWTIYVVVSFVLLMIIVYPERSTSEFIYFQF